MSSLTWVILLSFLLFSSIYAEKSLYPKNHYRPKAPDSLLKKKIKKTYTLFKDKKIARYMVGFNLGFLRKRGTEQNKNLNLLHLFTPSGIHLSSFLMFFFFFRKLRKSKHFFYFVLSVAFASIEGFYSIKRILLMLVLSSTLGIYLKIKLNFRHLFFIAFGIDFFISLTYLQSPLSFVFSFLFLGSLLTVEESKWFRIPLVFLCAQLLVCTIQQQTFYLLTPWLGTFLTFTFSFIFPILFLNFWLFDFLTPISTYLVTTYDSFVFYLSEFSTQGPELNSYLTPLIICLLFTLKLKLTKKLQLSIIALALAPQNLSHPLKNKSLSSSTQRDYKSQVKVFQSRIISSKD